MGEMHPPITIVRSSPAIISLQSAQESALLVAGGRLHMGIRTNTVEVLTRKKEWQ